MTEAKNQPTGLSRRGLLGSRAKLAGAAGLVGAMASGMTAAELVATRPGASRTAKTRRRGASPAISTNITAFTAAARPARCASSACRRCAS